MITLKAALIAASTIGTVAVGGGATWAMAGSHQEADLRPQGAKAPAVERELGDAVPSTAPTCLPAKPALPSAKLPETGVEKGAEKQVQKHLEQNPATRELPKVDVPETDLPGARLPDAQLPDAKVPDARGKVPADLPTCAPSVKQPTKEAPVTRPSARVPAKPGLPAVPRLDCTKLAPAVEVGGTVERKVLLAKGLRHVSTVPGSADLRKKNICAVTQKWADKTGRWITVETLRTPAGMTQNQLRQALKLPGGGTPVTVPGGTAGSILPDRGGVLLFDADGRSLLVSGSPVLAGGLKDVTTALAQAR
ncbi:hypothetical protein [Actinomadura sp. 6K520]|uniref:hypothetical protein n=1 Tax=Actinomadura sp. 6K520 TaxID=2530364 RepID=UPI00104B3A1C|nr:hypothetical protein [Actinomadura sp. 6K520]TDE33742.1 hypothetical protein E1289_11420 [Actinomadura sp. 6K520]